MHTEQSKKTKELLIARQGLKVVKLHLAKDEKISEHSTDADVVVVVLEGEGHFTINGHAKYIKKGDVFHMHPGALHAITATADLELIVNHMKLNLESEDVQCNGQTCSHN